MPTFTSQQAKNKWDSLKASSGVSLTAIAQGRGTAADYQRVSNVLNQQGGLAAQVFAQAASLAEVQAKKFEAAYAQVLAETGEKNLTAYELALNEQFAKFLPDVVGQLSELIEMSVLQSNEDLTKTMGTRFDHMIDMLPQHRDTPSVDDILAANDLLAERLLAEDEARWKVREPALIDKIAAAFESTLRSLAERINRERAQQQGGAHVPALAAPTPRLAGPAPQNVLQKAMPLLGGPAPSRATALVPAEPSASVMPVSVTTQHELTTAAREQTSLYQKLKDMLPSLPSFKRDNEQQTSDDEDKKANTWWRSFKNWFGDKKDKFDSWKEDNTGWLKSLGGILALAVLNPKLFQMLGEKIRKYLTWENLKEAVEVSWNWISDKASKVLDWIKDLLGLNNKTPTQDDVRATKEGKSDVGTVPTAAGDTKHANINNLTPEQQKQMAAMTKASGQDSEGPGFFNSALSKFGIVTPRMKDYNLAHTDANPNSKTYGHIVIAGKDQGVNPDFTPQKTSAMGAPTNRGRTSVTTPPPVSTPTATYSVESMNVPYRPGVSTLPPGQAPQFEVGTGDNRPQKGAMQMGISSFGFNAANSDSLTLMNTYHFTAG